MSLWSMPAWRPLMPIQKPSVGGCCCGCGAISVGCSPLPGSVFQYSIPACGQPPMPTGEPLWPLRGPHHVGCLSPWDLGLGFWLVDGLGGSCASPHWSSSRMVVPPISKRGSLGDRMSCKASSLHWGPQGGGPGNLLSKYTSW